MTSEFETNEQAQSRGSASEKAQVQDLSLLSMMPSRPPVASCSLDMHTKELDSVGPYLTNRVDSLWYCPGSERAYSKHEFSTVNTETGKQVELDDIFSKESLYDALMKNDVVKSALATVNEQPGNFDELEKSLENKRNGSGMQVQVTDHFGQYPSEKLDAVLNDHVLSNFAFDSVVTDFENDPTVNVSLLLDSGSEMLRNTLPYISIQLPVPAAQVKDFNLANSTSRGFLMKDSEKMGKETEKHFNVNAPYRPPQL